MASGSVGVESPVAAAGAEPRSGPEDVGRLLPRARPVRLLDEAGRRLPDDLCYSMPPVGLLRDTYRRMVIGRRFDQQAAALAKQGRLAVYPSSRGQEACQVGGVMALRDHDWVFPTYRDSTALVARGIDPVHVLTLLRGDWHCGYDPVAHRTAPQCTPLATHTSHAAGLAHGEARRGRDTVALVYLGDGATSEGDFHEGVNFAAVFRAPVVFLVQNNRYAISVPLDRQTAAPSLAYKGIGYGVASEQVDGNDPAAVLSVLLHAVAYSRAGYGPFLVEAHTYRLEPHTTSDDAGRYRDSAEVAEWLDRDPVVRLEAYLRAIGALSEAEGTAVGQEAEEFAADLRDRLADRPTVDPLSLFDHIYAEPPSHVLEQREQVRVEQGLARPHGGRPGKTPCQEGSTE
jgi:pyruvate dehydrogenase E1 component alpha subunit